MEFVESGVSGTYSPGMSSGICVVIPTFRREDDATAQADRFARMAVVSSVHVIDQAGTLAAHQPFTALQERAPEVHLVTQPNLGGSGGYARGMLESMTSTAGPILLSDDDAILPEEALTAMVEYQASTARPTIMGTGMLAAENPTMLVSQAEAVRKRDFMWGPADGVHEALDVKSSSEHVNSALRLRARPNYSGWWGTLLPPGAVAELGLPAPYFLKWDDAEYGLRATAHGYDTVVLPQARVIHPTWGAYKTQMGWTARILHRNRLTTAAAHGAGRGVVVSSLLHQIKHILAGHHLTATLWSAGIDQFLAGPQEWLGRDLARARQDGQELVDRWYRNHPERQAHPKATRPSSLPLGPALLRALVGLIPLPRTRVVLHLPVDDVNWRTTLGADVVVMIAPDGSIAGELSPQRATARTLLAHTVRQHAIMMRRWRRLRKLYRQALPTWTTPEAWKQMITRAEAEQAHHT